MISTRAKRVSLFKQIKSLTFVLSRIFIQLYINGLYINLYVKVYESVYIA